MAPRRDACTAGRYKGQWIFAGIQDGLIPDRIQKNTLHKKKEQFQFSIHPVEHSTIVKYPVKTNRYCACQKQALVGTQFAIGRKRLPNKCVGLAA